MHKRTIHLLLALSLPLLLSCNSRENRQSTESETAYTDYRDMVTDFEEDTLSETELRAMEEDRSWEKMKAQQQQQYQQKRKAVDQSLDQYEPARQEEIQDLGERYDLAMEKKDQQYQEASHRYQLRQKLLGLEIKKDDLSEVTSENIADTYQRFVDGVAENAQSFETRDWNLVEGWWSSLNSRFRSLQPELEKQTVTTIQQAQDRYKELRQQVAAN